MGCVLMCFGLLFCFMGHAFIGVLVILFGLVANYLEAN